MSNIVAIENIQVPAFLINRKAANSNFLAGLPQGGGFPTIGLKGTRFVVKSEGTEQVLPTVEISVVLIDAKPNLDKTFYAGKYDPNSTEAKSPDCYSKDGIKPDPASTLKQCESCAGCPMNQFGSGTDNQGNPSKGKACSDTKMLAIFAQNRVYGFKVTPSSLRNFADYCKKTAIRGVDLSTAITVIGFDPNFSFPVLTFNFGGFLNEEQCNKVEQLKSSVEVADIIGGTPTLNINTAVAAVTPKAIEAAPVSDPFAAAAPVEEKKPRAVKSKPVEVAAPVEDDDLADIAASLGL